MTPARMLRLTVACVVSLTTVVAAEQPASARSKLHDEHMARLRAFAAQKEKQAEAMAAKANEQIIPEYRELFTAAKKGHSQTLTNLYEDVKKRQPQYGGSKADLPYKDYWSTILEVGLGYFEVAWGEADLVQLAVDGFMKSIPDGCIYFGGTDAGRGLPTVFSKDHAKGDPFFTITQNALADGSYLDYLRAMYGERIQLPSARDSEAAFSEYLKDASERLRTGKLKPGEDVSVNEGRVSVSGQTAVMAINAILAKVIFEKNPDRQFYVEESFPLDWMYPHLLPVGQIMKLEREPVDRISDEIIKADREYWTDRLEKLLGARIAIDGSVNDLTREVEAIYVTRKSKVDPRYVENSWAQKAFSKWRSSIAGVYLWRVKNTKDAGERDRMARAGEFASRQAYLLCPYSPEGVYRYVGFLAAEGRHDDAKAILNASLKVTPDSKEFHDLRKSLSAVAK